MAQLEANQQYQMFYVQWQSLRPEMWKHELEIPSQICAYCKGGKPIPAYTRWLASALGTNTY